MSPEMPYWQYIRPFFLHIEWQQYRGHTTFYEMLCNPWMKFFPNLIYFIAIFTANPERNENHFFLAQTIHDVYFHTDFTEFLSGEPLLPCDTRGCRSDGSGKDDSRKTKGIPLSFG